MIHVLQFCKHSLVCKAKVFSTFIKKKYKIAQLIKLSLQNRETIQGN